MDPISPNNPHPVIEIKDPEIVEVDGQRTYRTILEYEALNRTFTHNVDVELEDNQDAPKFDEQIKALNRGIDNLHEEIRKARIEEEGEDPIREV